MTDFNFGDLDISLSREDDPGTMMVLEKFSQHCDAILHGQTYKEWGFNEIPNEFNVLKHKGYFVPNFYMVNPLYYVDIEMIPLWPKGGFYVGTVKDDTIFIIIPEEEGNLDDLNVEIAANYDPDIIESLPVVIFRRCRKPIGLDGICNDRSEDWTEKLHCKNDTSEFIGVFKAQRKGKSGGNNIFKMTKIFDRYYFDTTKIQLETAESH